MKNNILKLIKSSANNENAYKALENIYQLHDQLQYSSDIKQMAEDVYAWLHTNYTIDNVTFSLFDIHNHSKENIFVKGEEFFLDDDKSFFFIINTHTNQNAIVSFSATSKTHYEIIQDSYDVIQSAFFQVSPIIQSGILKKNYIQAHSIDSVTNVYNRQYLTEHLNRLILLSGKEYDTIYFLMIGIDRFKAVTDEFDYDVGDKVLIQLARVIHSNIAEFDLVSRLSGDEFLVAILSAKSHSHVETIANQIIEDFSEVEIEVNEGAVLKKTICIGYDTFEDTEESIDLIIKNSDTALYEAKNQGRSILLNFRDINKEDELELF